MLENASRPNFHWQSRLLPIDCQYRAELLVAACSNAFNALGLLGVWLSSHSQLPRCPGPKASLALRRDYTHLPGRRFGSANLPEPGISVAY